jgi:serine/threonine protein phosphatase PrpC
VAHRAAAPTRRRPQVGHFGSQPGANLFCVFDGHGEHGKGAAAAARQALPALLDGELRSYLERNPGSVGAASASATRGAVEVILSEVFAETERSVMRVGAALFLALWLGPGVVPLASRGLAKGPLREGWPAAGRRVQGARRFSFFPKGSYRCAGAPHTPPRSPAPACQAGVDLSGSGTTATTALQLGNRLWVAAAGDSRALLCRRAAAGAGPWRPQPLTLDHRPRRPSERERVQGAGARVMPKRLPSGQWVGEPRMWLQDMAAGPGLLISRSLGDLMATSVGCTSEPEVTYTTLIPGRDQFVVIASDGIWDVLSNEQVGRGGACARARARGGGGCWYDGFTV